MNSNASTPKPSERSTTPSSLQGMDEITPTKSDLEGEQLLKTSVEEQTANNKVSFSNIMHVHIHVHVVCLIVLHNQCPFSYFIIYVHVHVVCLIVLHNQCPFSYFIIYVHVHVVCLIVLHNLCPILLFYYASMYMYM